MKLISAGLSSSHLRGHVSLGVINSMRLACLACLTYLMCLVCFVCFVSCEPPEPELRSTPVDYGLELESNSAGADRAGSDEAGSTSAGSDDVGEWPSVSGYWRIDHRTVLRSELPVLLEEVDTVIDAVLIGEMTQERDAIWLHYRVCDVYMENTPDYNQTLLPDSFLEALPYRTRSAQLERRGEAWSLIVPKNYELRGIAMGDPELEPFPTSPLDARIFDQDRDFEPGMSARLVGFPEGDINLIQRSWDRWRGEFSGVASERVERIEGTLEWGDEQQIIAASNDVLKIEVDRWVPEEEGLHRFEMRRVSDLACPPRRPPPAPSQ